MIYKVYGKTGLQVSAVGFGGMRFDTSLSDAENARLLCYAVDQGITYLDTAPDYCVDHSEDIFGLGIKELGSRRKDIFLSTKGMPENCDSAEKARKAVEKSLSRLNTDYLDFYHVWCIRRLEEYERAMRPGGQYEGLLRCKEEGLIRHIVVSTHLRGPEVQTLLEKNEFEGVLLGVNILNFLYRWEGVTAACRQGMGVVAMNPLAGGVIPKNEQRLAFLAEEGETPTEAALRFCISCPQITVTLNGFSTREHIDTACRVADRAKPFSDEHIERIRSHVSNNMDSLCTGCGYCMGRCPVEIPIAGYMQYYNDKLLLGKTDAEMTKELDSQKKWGMLVGGRAAGDCIACGRCEMACTQHLDIVRRLDTIAQYESQQYGQ
jgi:predicted aldo/keto reductase-like oxidoreductase